MRQPSAVIVDGATFVRAAFPVLMPQLDVRAGFPTVDLLLDAQVPADIVVLELQDDQDCLLELGAALAALRRLVAAGYVVCVYTQEQRPFVHAACLACGAAGVVSKSAGVAAAQDAFIDVAGGGTALPERLLTRLSRLGERELLGVLSARDRQLLAARAQGLSFDEIAALLDEPPTLTLQEWHSAGRRLRAFLSTASLGTIVRRLGLDPGELSGIWPAAFTAADESRYETLGSLPREPRS